MWRVYYDDGTEWDHTQGTDGMPIYGVLLVLQSFLYHTGGNTGHHIVQGCPYYVLYEGTWLHFYENDLIDHITHDKHIDKLLVGRMVSKQVFGDVYKKAQEYKATFA
jgi:hypothetical protein